MSEYISSLITQLLVCLTGLIICVATQLQAHAAGGDIIISREVQPRAAARQELVPDPTPLVANPDRSAQVNSSLRAVGAPIELSDSDFAGISSGRSPGNGLGVLDQPMDRPAGISGRSGVGAASATPVGRAVGGGVGGATGRISGQVNRSVQQGLRPLQSLQGK